MKKLLLICIVGLITVFPLFAEEKKEVSLRYSLRDSTLRVVLEAEDNLINNANIIATLSSVKVEFPAVFNLKKQKDFIFDATARDRFLTVSMKNVEDIRTYKLTSPARLVIDIKLTQKAVQAQTGPNEKQPAPNEKSAGSAEKKAEPNEKPAVPVEKKAATAEKKAETKPEQKQAQEQPAAKPSEPKIVVIDAGHGGYDYGLTSKDSKEKDLDLQFAKDLNAAIAKKGSKVYLTRKVDQFLSLYERIMTSTGRKPDIFISIHSSASNAFVIYTAAAEDPATEASVKRYGPPAKQGRHLEKSRALAKAIGSSLKDAFKTEVIERELPLPVLTSMDADAVLIEYPSLKLAGYDQKKRDLLVNAVANGIRSYE